MADNKGKSVNPHGNIRAKHVLEPALSGRCQPSRGVERQQHVVQLIVSIENTTDVEYRGICLALSTV